LSRVALWPLGTAGHRLGPRTKEGREGLSGGGLNEVDALVEDLGGAKIA
jgi:hypothetical protein